ncbi:MAG: hypothetical protein WBL45_07500 [Solirubrobacterales bacterium]
MAARKTAAIGNTRGYDRICSNLGTSAQKCPKFDVPASSTNSSPDSPSSTPIAMGTLHRPHILAETFVTARQTAAISNARGYDRICGDSGTSAKKCPKFEVAV